MDFFDARTAAMLLGCVAWLASAIGATAETTPGLSAATIGHAVTDTGSAYRYGDWQPKREKLIFVGDGYLVSNDPTAYIEFVTGPPVTDDPPSDDSLTDESLIDDAVTADSRIDEAGDQQIQDSGVEEILSRRWRLAMVYAQDPRYGTSVPISVTYRGITITRLVDLTRPPKDGFYKPIGRYDLRPGENVRVQIHVADAGGLVHVDALVWMPSP